MLDVYRNFYGLTGEPFRLGPDHRFSLHHESYASAKAYLEYAIYQGEGFIAITGEPGTGKTTLISEILAGLDPGKVQVATLTSTQLESRDLLYMVASSFDLHLADSSKANLLVELESFLVRKIRVGQRAILIVDEAQGLSAGALEELRLLANLQHKYQLLLQIFLVGQEQLLDLINAPGMEHLHQRLVAATSLDPLSYDETVDYIEHRLSKVAWKGDPAIDEGALREIYRYSGGVPRRINLIANRLFLYGGMEEKHRFDTDDSHGVIKGLIDEFLLAAEPRVSEVEFAAASDSGEPGRSRSLPRDDLKITEVEPPPASNPKPGAEVKQIRPEKEPDTAVSEKPQPEMPSNRTEKDSDTAVDKESGAEVPAGRAETDRDAAMEERSGAALPPELTETHSDAAVPESVITSLRNKIDEMERPVPRSPARKVSPEADKKKARAKGVVLAVVLLAGAGSAYLLYEPTGDPSLRHEPVAKTAEAVPQIQQAPEQKVEPEIEQPEAGLPAKGNTAGIIVGSVSEAERDIPPVPKISGKILREQSPELAGAADESRSSPREVPPAAAKKSGNDIVASESVKPAESAEGSATADTEIVKPDISSIEARRLRLKQAAEQRFLARQVEERAKAKLVTAKPETQPATAPVKETIQAAAPAKPVPVKPVPVKPVPVVIKEPSFTSEDVVSTLLDGRWGSQGKAASLLPSETTFCNRQSGQINCLSVPQNVKTQYGLALYKVETTLSKFSPQGHFEMSYRTLVKLVGGGASKDNSKAAISNDGGWQITAYSMSCKLTGTSRVSCVDGKGVNREYLQAGLLGKQ